MGATEYGGGQVFIVKAEFEGETRLLAVGARPAVPDASLVKYDPKNEFFYDKGRVRTYTLDGTARYTILEGPNKGGTAPPLRRLRVELDRKTGHVLLYQYGTLDLEDYDNPKKLAYIVVP